ncbi:MAG: Ig-like domain-containing protein, partial [Candidatus Lokiarchaeia archaeon]
AFDLAGYNNTDSVSFTVDTTPPTVDITSPSDGAILPTVNVTVSWTGSDATTSIDYYEVRIDGGVWTEVGLNTSYTFTGLSDDPHTVEVMAFDQAGNNNTDSVSFTVDTTLPTVIIEEPPSDDSVNTGVIWINGTFDGTGSQIKNITINETTWFELVEPTGGGPYGVSGTYAFRNRTAIPTGEYGVLVTVEDQANLTGTAARHVIVDQDVPTVTIDEPSAGEVETGVIWINGTFDGTGSQITNITINETTWFELMLPSGAGPYGVSGTYAFRNRTAIPTGEYSVLVTVENQANLTGTATVYFTVDQDDPIVTIDKPPSDDYVNTGVIWINGTFDGTGSQVVNITIDDDRFILVEPSGLGPYGFSGNYSFMASGLGTGEFDVVVTVEDKAGHMGTTTRHVIVDQDDPTVMIEDPSTGEVKTGVIWINGTYNGTGSDVVSITINYPAWFELVEPSGAYGESGSYAFRSNTTIPTGGLSVLVTVKDQANHTGTATVNFIVDQDNPTVDIKVPADDNTVNTGVIWINGTFNGTGSQIKNITINDTRFTLEEPSGAGPYNVTGTYSFMASGILTSEFGVMVTVEDQANLTGTAIRQVKVDQDDPTVTIDEPQSGDLKTGVIWINGTFNGTGSRIVSITINDSARFELVEPSWPYPEIGNYSFRSNTTIPTGGLGLLITVEDRAGFTATATVYFTVDQDNPTIIITVPANDTTVNTGDIWIRGFYNGTGSNITAISCNNENFTLVTVEPFGVTGNYSFVNNKPIVTSQFWVQINVTDQMGFIGTAQRYVIVDQDNPTVEITIPPSDDTVNSGVIWINGTYNGTGSQVISIAINDTGRFELLVPSGAGPYSETGTYAFRNKTAIPTEEFGVRVTVTDGAGLTVYADRHVIVDQSVPLVTITVPASDTTVSTGVIWINGTYDGMGSNITAISCNDTNFIMVSPSGSPPFGETGTFSFVNNTPIATSEFWIQVSVTDQSSLTGTAQRRMIVDQDQPTITISIPASDTTINTGVIWINGTYDGTGSQVISIMINDTDRFELLVPSGAGPYSETGTYAFRNKTAIPTEEFGVRVTVTDGAGFTVYADRHVIVDQDIPLVSITVPASDTTVNTGVIWINGTYDGMGSSVVNITCNDTNFIRVSPTGAGPFGVTGTFSFVNNTPIATSEFGIQIEVTDQANLTGTASRHVIVDQSVPSVSITYPASDTAIITGIIWINGTYDGTGSQVISITINDTDRFELVVPSGAGPYSESGGYAFRNKTVIPTEEFGVRVTVTDGAGLTAYADRHVIVDQDIPLVSITVPAYDSTVNTGVIWINGTYDGRQSNVVQIICDDNRFILVTTPPFGMTGTFSFVNNTPIATSMFWIQINVTDQSSLTGTASRRIMVDQNIPLASITVPATDITVNTGVIWINGTYNGTGSSIQVISCNDTRFDLQTSEPFFVTGTYSFVNKTPISTGIFYVQVILTDGAGLVGSAVRRVVVDQSPPIVIVTTPYSDDTINVGTIIIRGDYDGTGSDIVQITCNDSSRFTLQNIAPFGETGTYVFINKTNIYDGNYGVRITVRDAAGFETVIVRHLTVRQNGVIGSGTWEINGINQYIDAVSVAGVELRLNTTAPVRVYITCTTTNLGGSSPSGYGLYGSFWSISVNDTDAVTGIRIYIRYTNESLANAGIEEDSLRIRYWDDATGVWIEIPSTLDIDNNVITGYMDHLTGFAILGTLVAAGVPISFYLQFLLFSQLTTSQINPILYLVLVFLAITIVIVSIIVVRGIRGRRVEKAYEIETPLSLVRPEAPGKPKCLYCGSDIPIDAKFCSYCGETKTKCAVCNRFLFFGDELAECPYCGALSHREHLLQWISLKGVCPKCKEKLSASHVKLKDFFENR